MFLVALAIASPSARSASIGAALRAAINGAALRAAINGAALRAAVCAHVSTYLARMLLNARGAEHRTNPEKRELIYSVFVAPCFAVPCLF